MKSISLVFLSMTIAFGCLGQTTKLSGVTIGFGAGGHYTLGDVKEYSLSTDTMHSLNVESSSKAGFTISSIVTVRLGHVVKAKGSNRLISENSLLKAKKAKKFSSLNDTERKQIRDGYLDVSGVTLSDAEIEQSAANPWERCAINLAINLADVNGDGLAFNKSIDGGVGFGYYLNDHVQISLFLDVMRYRQLRQYVTDSFNGKSIPNGRETYTSLDESNNDLFATKTFAGISLKVIYTVNANND